MPSNGTTEPPTNDFTHKERKGFSFGDRLNNMVSMLPTGEPVKKTQAPQMPVQVPDIDPNTPIGIDPYRGGTNEALVGMAQANYAKDMSRFNTFFAWLSGFAFAPTLC